MSPTTTPELLSRREAVRRVTALLGGLALTGGQGLLAAVERHDATPPSDLFSETQLALLDTAAETLLPETDTPGARAAGVGPFIALMVADTYDPDEQRIFLEGLAELAAGEPDFQSLDTAGRLQRLRVLDQEQYRYMKRKDDEQPTHWFRMFKELALVGYFTSEIGSRLAQEYVPVPGRYDPCAPLPPGGKSYVGIS